jgi:hypothetical protein
MLLTIAVILALIDLVTTLIGVRIAGVDSESNGMHRIILTRGGPVVFSLVYLAGATVLIAGAHRLGALASVVAVLVLVALNNLYALLRLRAARRE